MLIIGVIGVVVVIYIVFSLEPLLAALETLIAIIFVCPFVVLFGLAFLLDIFKITIAPRTFKYVAIIAVILYWVILIYIGVKKYLKDKD